MVPTGIGEPPSYENCFNSVVQMDKAAYMRSCNLQLLSRNPHTIQNKKTVGQHRSLGVQKYLSVERFSRPVKEKGAI